MTTLPIIVFFKGKPTHTLLLCFQQIKKFNPDSIIFHLGDNNSNTEGVNFIDVNSFSDFREFQPLYKHESHLPEEFELKCIERWFAINEFIKKEGIVQFLHLDADALVFCNVSEESDRFKDYDITVNKWNDNWYMSHYLQVNQPNLLDNFCKFIINTYQSPIAFREHCIASFNQQTKRPWVSDMSLLKSFLDSSGYKIYYLEDTLKDGIGFDNRILDYTGFRNEGHRKYILFKEGVPYCYLTNGTPIQMKILHYNNITPLMLIHERFLNP